VTAGPLRRVTETSGRAAETVTAMTEDERLWCLDGDAPFWAGIGYLGEGGYHKSPFRAARVSRLGFSGFAFSDGPRGVVVDQATCYPVSMARGATWDVELEERIGEAIGLELRAVGADLFGGVCVNILRHPAWGRAQETYGEDPHHVGEMGAALVRGVQRHAMACVKHFVCNSMENARFDVDVTVDDVALHEVYLPHFKRIVDEGVAVVMSAYNSVNGAWCGENRPLLTEVLREEWGFQGFVISDWILGLRDAGRSLHGGLDVEMPYRMVRAAHLKEALDAGVIDRHEVDRAVGRIVATVAAFSEILDQPAPRRDVLACPEHRALAREAANKSVVLLRNEEVDGMAVLPLVATGTTTVAVLGALGTAVNLGDGGSSDVWAPEVVTVAEGLRAALGSAAVVTDDGSDHRRARQVASLCDVALVVVGYTMADEGEYIGDTASHLASLLPGADDPGLVERFTAEIATERLIEPPAHVAPRVAAGGFAEGGDRRSLHLHRDDVALIEAVVAANPQTVVALVAGSAVMISEWDQAVPAIVQSWYSGMEGGHGLADVLLGHVDAAGRLPFSVPRSLSDLPAFDPEATSVTYDAWHGYWHLARRGIEAAYPFGFGLSYTTFSLTSAEVSRVGADLAVLATIANTGTRAGTDVLQVYGRRRGSSRPERLVGFRRIELDAEDGADLAVGVDLSILAERDTSARRMILQPGTYDLRVARHSADVGIALSVELGGD